jgi:prevent-host-death family protein
MNKVGSREFKNRMGRYLSAVRNGQTLVITDRGQPVAKLSPPDSNLPSEQNIETVLRRLEEQGLVRLAKRPMSRFRAAPSRGKSAAHMILEDRR